MRMAELFKISLLKIYLGQNIIINPENNKYFILSKIFRKNT